MEKNISDIRLNNMFLIGICDSKFVSFRACTWYQYFVVQIIQFDHMAGEQSNYFTHIDLTIAICFDIKFNLIIIHF